MDFGKENNWEKREKEDDDEQVCIEQVYRTKCKFENRGKEKKLWYGSGNMDMVNG